MNFGWLAPGGGRNEAAEMLCSRIRRSPSPRPSPHDSIGTSSIEHPTPNIEWQRASSFTSTFGVRCWAFDVFLRFRGLNGEFRETAANDLPSPGGEAGVRASVGSDEWFTAKHSSTVWEAFFRSRSLARHRLEAGDGQAAGNELAHGGDFALLQQRHGFDRVLADGRLGGIPIHQRQVVVAGGLALLHQRGEDV